MAAKGKFHVTKDTPIYAVFFSGLMKVRLSAPKHSFKRAMLTMASFQLPVQVRITAGNKDYKIDKIPAGVSGQVYVVLSKSNTVFSDENIIAGPAILEVYPKGKTPSAPHPKCS